MMSSTIVRPISAPAVRHEATRPASPPWLVAAVAGLAIAFAGLFLRLHPWASFQRRGFDEVIYESYLKTLLDIGLGRYPDVVEGYISYQQKLNDCVLPPTRFLYIFVAWAWHGLFGTTPLDSFRAVSRCFSVLNLVLGAAFAGRLGGQRLALGVGALLAFSPLQIHMAQHALIDGFFAFWAMLALWALWENLQTPDSLLWQGVYTGALALMVLTKENALFVYVALLGLLALNQKLGFGRVSQRLLLLTVLGPLIGGVALIFLAGGLGNVIEVYRLLVTKAQGMAYAIETGDGPWYRYLVDLMLISPLVLLLAIGGLFRAQRSDRATWFLFGFIVFSYALMTNVRYGMNLRYATIWDLPLRVMALAPLVNWTQAKVGGHSRLASGMFTLSIGLLCAYDLRQYWIFFVQHDLYELVSEGLLRAVNILK